MNDELIALTADIVSAYVSNNPVPVGELPGLISDVSQSLDALKNGAPAPAQEPQKPAVNPKKSVHADYIICLEDGLKFKSLKRHLSTRHGLTPEEYRTKWGLAADYPMTAPGYSAARSTMAKSMGLGRKPGAKPAPKGRRKAKA